MVYTQSCYDVCTNNGSGIKFGFPNNKSIICNSFKVFEWFP